MKKIVILLFIVAQVFISYSQLKYEIKEQIKKSSFFEIGTGIIDYDMRKGLGVSGYVNILNIAEKFSIRSSYEYIYLGKNGMEIGSIRPIDYKKFLNSSFEIGGEYTFMQKKGKKSESIMIGNNVFTSEIDQKYIKSFFARFGFINENFGIRYKTENDPIYLPTNIKYNNNLYVGNYNYYSFLMHQTFSMVYLGFGIRESFGTHIFLEKYGDVYKFSNNEYLFDLIFSFKSQLYDSYLEGNDELLSLTPDANDILKSNFKRLPVGFRAIYRINSKKGTGFGVDLFAGMYPMYYRKIYETINVGLKLNIRYLKKIK